MKPAFVCLNGLCLLVSFTLLARPPIEVGQSEALTSVLLQEDREIWIALPKNYQRNKAHKYPLLLVLDARALFQLAAAVEDSLASSGAIPEMLVVGIKNTDRWRDLTPTADPNWASSGGGDKFLGFIRTELLPHLQKNYRLAPFTLIAGHSLGGLMAVHASLSGQLPAQAFIAISPTLSWSDTLFAEWQSKLSSDQVFSSQLMYMAIADERQDASAFARLSDDLQKYKGKYSEVIAESFADSDDHHSIRAPALLNGVRWIYREWQLRPQQVYQMTAAQIEAFYRNSSRKYATSRSFDLMQMTNAAYWGLGDRELQQQAMALFQSAVTQWPKQAYAWACLGEGYLRTGEHNKAVETLQHAVQLGDETGFADMAYLQGLLTQARAAQQAAH